MGENMILQRLTAHSQEPMTHNDPDTFPDRKGWHASLVAHLSLWKRNLTTRRDLAKLDPDLLRDVGITEEERRDEILKPFWS